MGLLRASMAGKAGRGTATIVLFRTGLCSRVEDKADGTQRSTRGVSELALRVAVWRRSTGDDARDHPEELTMPSADQVVRCHLPWQSMVIAANGRVLPCGYWGSYGNVCKEPLGNINRTSLLGVWNGERYQRLRRNMAAGDLEAAGCSNCLALRQGFAMGLTYDVRADEEDPPCSPYAKHVQLLRREIREHRTTLESVPTCLSVTPSHHCNLRCTHCYQDGSRNLQLSRWDILEEVLELLPKLVRITAGGGEPFLIPFWQQFVLEGDISANPYLEFTVTTNATAITDEILRGLGRFSRLGLSVSFDGATKEVYESIRKNANYERVVAGIDALRELVRRKPGSALGLCFSAMKANLTDMPELIRFAHAREVCFSVLPVMEMPLDQTLNCLNDPAREMQGWREAIGESYRVFDELYGDRLSTLADGVSDVLRNQVVTVEKAIPWHILTAPHFVVNGRVPRYLSWAYSQTHGRNLFVAFWTLRGDGAPVCEHYAPLENGQYDVRLPAGEYALEIHSRHDIPQFTPCLYLVVTSAGDSLRLLPTERLLKHSRPKSWRKDVLLRLISRHIPGRVKQLLRRVYSP